MLPEVIVDCARQTQTAPNASAQTRVDLKNFIFQKTSYGQPILS
jgi:hypothetical protein